MPHIPEWCPEASNYPPPSPPPPPPSSLEDTQFPTDYSQSNVPSLGHMSNVKNKKRDSVKVMVAKSGIHNEKNFIMHIFFNEKVTLLSIIYDPCVAYLYAIPLKG
jgi:hypothetical protein